jgi:hypothetical protein
LAAPQEGLSSVSHDDDDGIYVVWLYSDKASSFFKTILNTGRIRQVSLKHILISLTGFMGTPNYENIAQYSFANRIIGFLDVCE